MKLSHSYSSIKLYENCPYRYFRQRVLKDVVDEGGEASKHGERVHAYLEHRLKSNNLLPQEIAHYEPLCQSVERLAENILEQLKEGDILNVSRRNDVTEEEIPRMLENIAEEITEPDLS